VTIQVEADLSPGSMHSNTVFWDRIHGERIRCLLSCLSAK